MVYQGSTFLWIDGVEVVRLGGFARREVDGGLAPESMGCGRRGNEVGVFGKLPFEEREKSRFKHHYIVILSSKCLEINLTTFKTESLLFRA